MNLPSLSLRPLLAVASLAVLAGCAGTAGSPSASGAVPFTQAQGSSPMGVIADKGSKCKSDNGVSVHPCSVTLSLKNPTVNITAKGPAKGTFSVNDTKCETGDIATVTGSGDQYVVTAGTTSGTCTAKFEDKDQSGKNLGTAKLKIENNLE
jgi:hypothetical protein